LNEVCLRANIYITVGNISRIAAEIKEARGRGRVAIKIKYLVRLIAITIE